MTRQNRRAIRPSESAIAKVTLEFLNEETQLWQAAPARYAFLTDEKARAYAEKRYAPGVSIRTNVNPTVTVTGN